MADDVPWDGPPTPALSGELWGAAEGLEGDEQARAEVRYRRGGVLGSGGMGVVYAAQDDRLQRLVALKVAHDPELLGRRMAREARITAQLEHPGIVAVYDAGEDPDGRPWYAMRLIRGRTLEERIREAEDLQGRLSLLRPLLAACEAVAFAHDRGVVHRDLKAANILVGEFGETLVADWGLARPTEEAEQRWRPLLPATPGGQTQQGAVVGSLATMSPEQARGEVVGPPADVFALGVVLYELLTGRPARRGVSEEELLERVRGGQVPDVAADAPAHTPSDLLAVAIKALRPAPEDRYPDAGALARDLARLLDGRRVSAHRYTPTERLARGLRRWRLPLGVAATALVALGMVVAAFGLRNAEDRTRAEQAEAQARVALEVADENLAMALVNQARIALERGARPEAEVLAAHALLRGEDPVARGVLAAFGGARRPRRLARWRLPEGCGPTPRLSPDGQRLLCVTRDELAVWEVAEGRRAWSRSLDVDRARWLPDRRVVADSRGGELVVIAEGGQIHRRLPIPAARGPIPGPDPQRLLFASRHMARELDIATGELRELEICPSLSVSLVPGPGPILRRCDDGVLRRYDNDGALTGAWSVAGELGWTATHREGDRVVAATSGGELMLLDLSRSAEEGGGLVAASSVSETSALQVLMVPGTELVLVRTERGGPQLWDTASNSSLGRLPGRAIHAAAGPEPGQVVLVGDAVELWQLPVDPSPWAVPVGAGVSSVDVSADGERLVWAHGSGEVGVVTLDPWREEARLRWQDGVVKGAAFSPDGARLFASGMHAKGGRVFSAEDGWASSVVIAPPEQGRTFRRVGGLAPDSVWGLTYSGGSGLFELGSGALSLAFGDDTFFDGASSPGLGWAALLSSDGGVWRLGPGPALERVGRDDEAIAVDISEDGRRLVLGHPHAVCALDLDQGQVADCHPLDERVLDVALAPGGRQVAVGTLSGAVWLLDLETGRALVVLHGHGARVATLAFHPSGERLFTGSWDGQVRSWDLRQLDTPAEQLVAEVEAAWDLDLAAALRRR